MDVSRRDADGNDGCNEHTKYAHVLRMAHKNLPYKSLSCYSGTLIFLVHFHHETKRVRVF